MDSKKKAAENTYVVSPQYAEKFHPREVQTIMREVMKKKIESKTGSVTSDQSITKAIADEIRERLKESKELVRYKFIVQVIMGDQKGQGIRMGTRCFWDPTCDAYATETYRTETVFCVATAYGVYHY